MKKFEMPVIEVKIFDVEDIITTSNPQGDSEWGGTGNND